MTETRRRRDRDATLDIASIAVGSAVMALIEAAATIVKELRQ